MGPVLVTRTPPGAQRTLTRLRELGFEAVEACTAEIRPLPVEWPGTAEAIAITSPNGAARAAELAPDTNLPAYAVGDATAQVMREAGFSDVTSAAGDGAALARLILAETVARRFVHVRGADQGFDLVQALSKGGVKARSLIAYAAEPVTALSESALDAIRPGTIVLVHSPRGAARFVDLVSDVRSLGGLAAVAISSDAAAPLLQAGLARIDIASAPHEEAMMTALTANRI